MQLNYRGQSFEVQSGPTRRMPVAGPLTRTLRYQGNTYTCRLSAPQSSTPRAINWRYEIA